MTSSVLRYFILNQLLLRRKFKELPTEAQKQLEEDCLVEIYKDVVELPRQDRPPIEQMFLNMLRTSDYMFNLAGESKAPLSIAQVADSVRDNNLPVDKCVGWAIQLISKVVVGETYIDYVADSVLYLSEDTYKAGIKLDQAMANAFEYYCWGKLDATSPEKGLVQSIICKVFPVGEVAMDAKSLRSILLGLQQYRINPADIGNSVVKISDLSLFFRQYGCLASWVDESQLQVQLIVPKYRSATTVVRAMVNAKDFIELAQQSRGSMGDFYVKGGELHIKEL